MDEEESNPELKTCEANLECANNNLYTVHVYTIYMYLVPSTALGIAKHHKQHLQVVGYIQCTSLYTN